MHSFQSAFQTPTFLIKDYLDYLRKNEAKTEKRSLKKFIQRKKTVKIITTPRETRDYSNPDQECMFYRGNKLYKGNHSNSKRRALGLPNVQTSEMTMEGGGIIKEIKKYPLN